MAGGGGGHDVEEGPRELDQTPTWAVSTVCGVIILISIVLEMFIHKIGEFFDKRKKKALLEALLKIKNELMVLGFISLLLTFGQNYIATICVPSRFGQAMSFCGPYDGSDMGSRKTVHHKHSSHKSHHERRLLSLERRILANFSAADCDEGYVALISLNALHQIHIFIFFLAVFHVIYSAITMMLGRAKIREWKVWEQDIMTEQELMNDPSRFRLTHETSFVREHVNPWTRNRFSFYIICFLRQMLRSVRKSDYLTMRHGFISVHLSPGMKFNFQKYIKRSLEDDFKVVVGISPPLWAFVMLFLLFDVHGWYITAVITMVPPTLTLAIGTKLQAIISDMALEIQERHAVIQGMPLVSVSDSHFWFGQPALILHMIHFVLFQNAFEITYFFWIWYEFGLRSCFHHHFALIIVRVCLGVGVQFLCSYITLPLYALVTQMGSTMKRSVFDHQTSKALKQWHKKAKRKSEKSGQLNSFPSRNLGGQNFPADETGLRPYSVRDIESAPTNVTAGGDENGRTGDRLTRP
ncbi:PREDICTED: MLO-like protein 9 [Tarenaya hassleriana]|uniref:MLO-like protein 9 n=1 Tax=Tarenaya hassleriana TaxID=28532 RepID=UPI00053C3360|nr:PREDICTED: MLO-like protein 9 [Tarenaya hassleriana]